MRISSLRGRNLHFILTLAFSILLIPACFYTRLRIDPPQYSFFFTWAVQSTLWASFLYQFGVPGAWNPFRTHLQRLIPLAFLVALLFFLFGRRSGAMYSVAGAAICEFSFRKGRWNSIAKALLPWLYLSLGIEVALAFSSVIVSLRPSTQFDGFFTHLDSYFLFGASVVQFSHALPLYLPAEAIYYSMGGIMGATLLFLCLAADLRAAFQTAGAILTAYYLSVVVSWFFPAQGPFLATALPHTLFTAGSQHASIVNAAVLYHHRAWITAPPAFYVSFPSMHIAQPIIAAWSLRRWPRASALAFAYCALLVPCILILEWHYFVDILSGILVAILALAFVSQADHLPDPVPSLIESPVLPEANFPQ